MVILRVLFAMLTFRSQRVVSVVVMHGCRCGCQASTSIMCMLLWRQPRLIREGGIATNAHQGAWTLYTRYMYWPTNTNIAAICENNAFTGRKEQHPEPLPAPALDLQICIPLNPYSVVGTVDWT